MVITITGERNEGKTYLSKYLYHLLTMAGHNVEIPIEDGISEYPNSMLQEQVKCGNFIGEKIKVMNLKIKVQNKINTK